MITDQAQFLLFKDNFELRQGFQNRLLGNDVRQI